MFKDTTDYIVLAVVCALAFGLYVVNHLTLNVIVVALVAILLILSVLIQNPKGGGVDSTFGGAATNQMFGAAKSTDFIERVTWHLVIALFVLCVATTILPSLVNSGGLDTLRSE